MKEIDFQHLPLDGRYFLTVAHFYKYANKVVYQLDFLKMNLLHKSKMKCFKSRSSLRTCSKFITQAISKWTYTNKTEYFGTV